jgi:hypothetical protein
MNLTLKEIVKDNVVRFVEYRKGFLYYSVLTIGEEDMVDIHLFPVPIEDCGDATFPAEEKAILFMRYIRKAIDDGTFVKI